MKTFRVDQTGELQLTVNRQFIIEVPDDWTEENLEEFLLEDEANTEEIPRVDEGKGERWFSFCVDQIETDIIDELEGALPDIKLAAEHDPKSSQESYIQCQYSPWLFAYFKPLSKARKRGRGLSKKGKTKMKRVFINQTGVRS